MLDGGTYWRKVALQLGSSTEEQRYFSISTGLDPGRGGAGNAEED